MTGVSFEINYQNVNSLLQRMLDQSRDYSPAWEKVAIQAERSIGMNFRAQGRPGKWAPLSPKTLAARRKKGTGAKILADRGLLKASVTSNVSIKRIQPQRIEYGTNLVYAATHQYGRGRIPARPFLKWQDADLNIAKRIFIDHIMRG